MERKVDKVKKSAPASQTEIDAREGLRPSPFAAVFPELPPILDHLTVRVRDLNGYMGAENADFAQKITDAPERNAIEVGLKFSF